MKRRFSIILGLVLLLTALMAFEALAAITWQQKNIRFSGTAGEALSTGDVVAIKPSDGKVYKADADSSTLRPAVGVIGKGGAISTTVEVIVSGIITGMTAASPGARIFLDATSPGVIVTTAPTNAQAIGWVMPGAASAATSTTYFINIQMPVSTGAAF